MSDSETLWAVAHQASLFMGFSRQDYWSGLPCPPPGDLPDPGTEPASLMSPALAGGLFTTSATREAPALYASMHKHVSTYTYTFTYPHIYIYAHTSMGFPGGSVIKNLPANAGDVGSVSG